MIATDRFKGEGGRGGGGEGIERSNGRTFREIFFNLFS